MNDKHQRRHGLFRNQPQEETPPGERVWRRFLQAARYITDAQSRRLRPGTTTSVSCPALPASPVEAAVAEAVVAQPGTLP